MPRKSAGLLPYRQRGGSLEVFLVHPGGPFWARKDYGAWSIPKGEFDEGEDPFEAAKREFREETGLVVKGDFRALEPVRQKGGKIIYAWAVECDLDAAAARSNTFSMEWPRGSGREVAFPEIDRAEWFNIALAKRKIVTSQTSLLEQLEKFISLHKSARRRLG